MDPLEGFHWIEDLIYFESPLVSHFAKDLQNRAIKYWIYQEDNFDYYLISIVNRETVLKFKSKYSSILSLIANHYPNGLYLAKEPTTENLNITYYSVQYQNINYKLLPTGNHLFEEDLYSTKGTRTDQGKFIFSKDKVIGIIFKNGTNADIPLHKLAEVADGLDKFQSAVADYKYTKSAVTDRNGKRTHPRTKKDTNSLFKYNVPLVSTGSIVIFLENPTEQDNSTLYLGKGEIDEMNEFYLNVFKDLQQVSKLDEFIGAVSNKSLEQIKYFMEIITDNDLKTEVSYFQPYDKVIQFEQLDKEKANIIIHQIDNRDALPEELITLNGLFTMINLDSRTLNISDISTDIKYKGVKFDSALDSVVANLNFSDAFTIKMLIKSSKGAKESIKYDYQLQLVE